MYIRPENETFFEFLLDPLLWDTIGKEWHEKQLVLPVEKRHEILKWSESYVAWRKGHIPVDTKEIEFSIPVSGEVRALASLMYDIFLLRNINKLPYFLIDRLKNYVSFQSVRYEIAVAVIMARSGFDITFLDNVIKVERHCEFIAKDIYSGVEIGVEAKSRHRGGVLHQKGRFEYNREIRGEFRGLFQKACTQKPPNLPYFIFLDINLPPSPKIPHFEKPWQKDVMSMVSVKGQHNHQNPDSFNALICTNFSDYYAGRGHAVPGEFTIGLPPHTQTRLTQIFHIIERVKGVLESYGDIPEEV